LALLVAYTGTLLAPVQRAAALSNSDFTAGHIIDDAIFTNANTMSVQDIQNFLNSKVPTCSTNHTGFTGGTGTVYNPPFVCLKDFYENPNSSYAVGFSYTDTNGNTQTGSRTYYNNNAYKVTALCPVYSGYSGTPSCGSGDYHNGLDHLIPTLQTSGLGTPSGAQSAAQIIYNAAQQYDINPQVLIVLLQKEQGLVTDDWPASYEYQAATGYGCPDTAPCSSNYAGFSNQIISAAWQFRQYLTHPNNYNYVVGSNYIKYNPDSRCGGSTINIQNQATAALYDYTPYQPNSYALGGGTSSAYPSCGAYGNLNFWNYFNSWFGSPYFTVNISYAGADTSVDNVGDIAVVPVVLAGPPVSTIQLNYGVSNPSLAKIVGKSSLIFTPSNWNVPQDITVQGLGGSANSQNFNLQVLFINSPDGAFSQSITPYLAQLPMFWSNINESAVYRLYDSSTGKHAYAVSTSALNSLQSNGYSIESTLGYQCAGSTTALLVENSLGLVRPFGNADLTNVNTAMPTILFSNSGGDIGVTILKNSAGDDTVLSSSSSEINSLQQSGYTIVTSVELCNPGSVHVYRLYDPVGHTHFYTSSAAEADNTLGIGFQFEGIAFYNNPADSLPVYRLYDPVGNTHFYTSSAAESSSVQRIGFRYEGVAWYAK
jgi:hypothetical protein